MGAEAALRPAPEVVGEPDRGDRARRPAPRARRAAPTSGSRSPRWLTACGPQASTRSASWRPRCANPRRSRPVGAVLEVELDLLHLEPGADGVDRHPRLDPEAHRDREDRRARARGQVALPGERLAQREPAAQPDQRARAPSSRGRGRRRRAPRTPRSRARRSESASGRRSPRRSASQRRSGPGSSCRSASVSACPLPRRASLITRAPASSARSAVASREPSSATTITASGNCARSASTVAPIRSSSSRAATRTVSRPLAVAHPCGWTGGIDGSTPSCGRLADAVAPGLAAGEEEHEPEPAGRGVDRVDGREARPARTPGMALGRVPDASVPTAGTPDRASPP